MKKAFSILILLAALACLFVTMTSCGGSKNTLILELNGGTLDANFDGDFEVGDEFTLPIPSKAEHYFDGWYADAAFNTPITEPYKPAESTTVYAKWVACDNIDIMYNKNLPGTTIINVDSFTTSYTPGVDKVELSELSKEGYKFLGWYLDEALTAKATTNLKPDENGVVELYAKWFRYSLLTYENINDSDIVNLKEYTTYFTPGEDKIVLPTLLRTGYDFLGWYLDSELKNEVTEETIMASSASSTFYAKWSRRKVTISWELDGATVASDNYTKVFYYGDSVTLPQVTKSGMKLMGWYLDKDFKTPITESNIKTTNVDISVYALFAPVVTFTIDGTSLSEFRIVIAADADLDTEYNAKRMQEFFEKRTGQTLAIVKDTEPASAHEIILGKTNRTVSAALALDEYKISIKDGHFVFDAGHYAGMNEALGKFLDVYGNPKANVVIPASYAVSGKTEIPLTWNDDGKAETLGSKPNFTIPVKEGAYKLVWSDEFDDVWGTGNINTEKWDLESHNISGVKHQVDYSTLRVENGQLSLFVDVISPDSRKNPVDGYSYKMAKTLTNRTMNYRYGYLEMRAAVPFLGTGEVPSFWGASCYAKLAHPTSPQYFMEVDIFEQFSTRDTVTPTLHKWGAGGHASLQSDDIMTGNSIFTSGNRTYQFSSQSEAQQVHTYGFLWTEHVMAFSVDGVFYYAIGLDDFFDYNVSAGNGMKAFREQALNVILYNLIFREAGFPKGEWGYEFSQRIYDEMFPYSYNIEYMRLYQIDGYGDLWVKGETDVQLALNGGEYEGEFNGKVKKGDVVSLPTPTRDGYTFAGWYTSSNFGINTKLDGAYTAAKDGVVTIYAKWTAN